jgi:hypothetical protein
MVVQPTAQRRATVADPRLVHGQASGSLSNWRKRSRIPHKRDRVRYLAGSMAEADPGQIDLARRRAGHYLKDIVPASLKVIVSASLAMA